MIEEEGKEKKWKVPLLEVERESKYVRTKICFCFINVELYVLKC